MKITAKSLFLLIILSVIWGTSFILIKKGIVSYTPDQAAALRVFLASIVFLPYVIYNFKKINFKVFKYILAFAILEIAIPPFMYSYAQTVVNSGTAGILNSLVPLFTLLTGFFIFRIHANYLKVLGVLLGLVGAILLVYFKNGDFTTIDLANSWGLLIVVATLCYGLAGNILKEHLQNEESILVTGVAFIVIAIPLTIYLFTTDFVQITFVTGEAMPSFWAIAILAFFSSSVAMVLFTKLIQTSTALFASFVTYLIPFVALLWGYFDGEGFGIMQFSALSLILIGIYIANIGIRKDNK